jgi:hypothetical protein
MKKCYPSKMKKTLKLLLALLLLACLSDFPYGYFQLVRFSAMAVFGYLAFEAQQRNKTNEVVIYIVLALLFQPFLKIALGRTLWNLVDVVIAVGLIASVFIENRESHHKKE